MPVIVPSDRFREWLEGDEAASLLKPFEANRMEAFPVSTAVNRPQNDSAECIEPLSES